MTGNEEASSSGPGGAEDQASELEEKVADSTCSEQQEANRIQKEASLRGLWDIKSNNIRILGVPEGEPI